MSDVSAATAMIAMQAADATNALVAKMVKMNARQAQAMASILDQAAADTKAVAAAPSPGSGALVDRLA